MKRNIFLSLIGLLFFYNGSSQADTFELIGTLEIENLNTITLKLSFTADKNGKVKGISITDFYGEDRTLSKIKGTLDYQNQLLSFKEIANISTKSTAPDSTFCFIEVKDLPLSIKDERNVARGNFTGRYKSGEKCATGTLSLVGANFLEGLIAEVSTESDGESQEERTQVIPASFAQNIITQLNPNTKLEDGTLVQLNHWMSDTVKIELWDSYEEDNDQVNIYINGALTYPLVVAKERKQYFKFALEGSTTLLKIEALNEGTNPPNTVNAHLIDNGHVIPLVTKLLKGQAVMVEINRNVH